jgi:hypothetical protein
MDGAASRPDKGGYLPKDAPAAGKAVDVRRIAPDMRVVTKGWWTHREVRQPVEALERQDSDEQRHRKA